MNEHEEIAKALKMRLSELRTHLAKVGQELHKPLSADSEEQATPESVGQHDETEQAFSSAL